MKVWYKNSKKKDGLQIVYGGMVVVLLLFLLVMASYLAYNCVRYSCTVEYSQQIWLVIDKPLKQVAVFLFVCAGMVVLELLLRKLSKYEEKIGLAVLIMTALAMGILGFLLIKDHPYYPNGDQLNTAAAAAYARQGNYSMFVRGGYIGLFPQQKGIMIWYELIYTLFGDFCFDVLEKIHVIYCIITLVCGYFMLKNWGQRAAVRIVYCVLMVTCVPFFIYIPYIYGDLPSICFSVVLFWAVSAYGKKYRIRYVVIASIAAAMALMMRKNILIVLIALAIGMILMSLKKKSFKPFLASLCILGVALGSVEAVDVMYEYRSGYEKDMGIPSILWVAMGLQETNGMPGRYNRYQQSVFEDTGFDREFSSWIGKEYIRERIEEFQTDPGMAADFFHRKLIQQWVEPTFESFCYTSTFPEEAEITPAMDELYYGFANHYLRQFCNYYQTIVYLAFWLFIIGQLAERAENSTIWIPLIAIIGGFLFSLIWESKCRYVFPYYMYMIFYVPMGLGNLTGVYDMMREKLPGRKRAECE